MEISRNGRFEDKNRSDRNNPNENSEEAYEEYLNNCCLSETNINEYMELINKHSPNNVYAFNTNFMTAFANHGYSSVNRWTKNIDIFSKKKLFIPIYFKAKKSWSLAIVYFHDQTIRFYDSIGKGFYGGIWYQKLILKYLKLEYLMRKKKFFCSDYWKGMNLNRSNNRFKLWDSGILLCLAVHYFAQNKSNNATISFPSTSVGTQEKVKKTIIQQIERNSLNSIFFMN